MANTHKKLQAQSFKFGQRIIANACLRSRRLDAIRKGFFDRFQHLLSFLPLCNPLFAVPRKLSQKIQIGIRIKARDARLVIQKSRRPEINLTQRGHHDTNIDDLPYTTSGT